MKQLSWLQYFNIVGGPLGTAVGHLGSVGGNIMPCIISTLAFLWHHSRAATGLNFIGTKEEKALYISKHNTVDWKRQKNIPDSDGLNWGQTRKRSHSFNSSF